MTTIYVVTSGEYSDYSIRALFSTKELAQDFIDIQPNPQYHRIEEYEIDKFERHIREDMRCYRVAMDIDGNSSVYPSDFDSNDEEYLNLYHQSNGVKSFVTYLYAKDEAHAAKIANEKRVQLIASGEWSKV